MMKAPGLFEAGRQPEDLLNHKLFADFVDPHGGQVVVEFARIRAKAHADEVERPADLRQLE